MRQADLLVIEDDSPLALLVTETAELEGMSVFHVGTAFDALEYLKNFTPKLILLDLILPDLNGVEVVRKLRSDPRLMHIPVVLWTGYISSPLLLDNKYLFDQVVSKPVKIGELVKDLKKYVGVKVHH